MLWQRESGMVSPKISAKSHSRKAEERKYAGRKAPLLALCKNSYNSSKSEETSSGKISKVANTAEIAVALNGDF